MTRQIYLILRYETEQIPYVLLYELIFYNLTYTLHKKYLKQTLTFWLKMFLNVNEIFRFWSWSERDWIVHMFILSFLSIDSVLVYQWIY